MIRFIRGIIGVVVVVFLTAISVVNVHEVPFFYMPTGEDGIAVVAYALILGGFFAGFVIGAFVMWMNMWPKKRAQTKHIYQLEAALKTIKPKRKPQGSLRSRLFGFLDRPTDRVQQQKDIVEL